jgi:hypothetical protein
MVLLVAIAAVAGRMAAVTGRHLVLLVVMTGMVADMALMQVGGCCARSATRGFEF